MQAVIAGRNNSINIPVVRRNRNNSDFPLRRIIKCGGCGAPLTGAWSKGHTTRNAYYICQKRCGAPSIRACDLDLNTIALLKTVTPKKESLDAFISLLRASYYKRVGNLVKKKEMADVELKRLQNLRQALVEKNLSGVYSDEIFREQNKLIESQIICLQTAKNDELVTKYNLEDVIKFMRSKFEDLGKTYQESTIDQVKILIGSIFPSGLSWNYPGYSNPEISALYQPVLAFCSVGISDGDPTGNRTPLYRMKTCRPSR